LPLVSGHGVEVVAEETTHLLLTPGHQLPVAVERDGAEGVETREEEEHLRAFGCDYAQGFLYERPQPADAVSALLAAAPR
jgi:EAL domain-containing protein (putative c-di-GMP-specific phosphodiesterase class I)